MLGLSHKSVNFGAEKSLGSPNWSAETDAVRDKTFLRVRKCLGSRVTKLVRPDRLRPLEIWRKFSGFTAAGVTHCGTETRQHTAVGWLCACLTDIVHKVVLKKSIPAQIRQLFSYDSNNKEYVDEFVRESTLEKRRCKCFL